MWKVLWQRLFKSYQYDWPLPCSRLDDSKQLQQTFAWVWEVATQIAFLWIPTSSSTAPSSGFGSECGMWARLLTLASSQDHASQISSLPDKGLTYIPLYKTEFSGKPNLW